MRLSFEVIYDSKMPGNYDAINGKGCEIVDSGSGYMRIKQGDNILGTIYCPYEEKAPHIKCLMIMIDEKMVNKNG